MNWRTSQRTIDLSHVAVMGILNVTPDSFSDGGRFADVEEAVRHGEQLVLDGADILDIGGESTRPGSSRVPVDIEIARVVPVIEALAKKVKVPISVDTTKYDVARAALDVGAEIINDISGLRWEPKLADLAADANAGLVLMHSRGEFDTMHSYPAARYILEEVHEDLRRSTSQAVAAGVPVENIVIDIGIGFGKTQEQNLELIAKLDRIVAEFHEFPVLVGASRKSVIAKSLGDIPSDERLAASLGMASIAVWNGANIVRVHDVKETVQAVAMVNAVLSQK